MRTVLIAGFIASMGCGPGYEGYHDQEMTLSYTTDAGGSVSASGPWVVADFEEESSLEPRGVYEFGDLLLLSRYHEASSATGADPVHTRFSFREMFLYGPTTVTLNVSTPPEEGEIDRASFGELAIDVEGIDVSYSPSLGFSWTFSYDTNFDGMPFGTGAVYAVVTESTLSGQMTIGADCRGRAAVDACGVPGAPQRYCGRVWSGETEVYSATGTCPAELVEAFLRVGTVYDNSKYHASLDLGGDLPLECSNNNYCGFSQCYAETEIEIDGCTWRAQALGFQSISGVIVGKPDASCNLEPCSTPYLGSKIQPGSP